MVDRDGWPIVVGCRVHIRPEGRKSWGGRVVRAYVHPKRGAVVEVHDRARGFNRHADAADCRVQRGETPVEAYERESFALAEARGVRMAKARKEAARAKKANTIGRKAKR